MTAMEAEGGKGDAGRPGGAEGGGGASGAPSGAGARGAAGVVAALREEGDGARLAALKEMRNQVIGSRARKACFVAAGAAGAVAGVLAEALDAAERAGGSGALVSERCGGAEAAPEGTGEAQMVRGTIIQASAVLGSLACGAPESLDAVLACHPVELLVRTLWIRDPKVVETGARTLKMICHSHSPEERGPPQLLVNLLIHSPAVGQLLRLLQNIDSLTAEVTASVLARCCVSRMQQLAIAEAGGLDALCLLLESSLLRVQEAGLEALASLTSGNQDLCTALYAKSSAMEHITQLTRSPSPRMRLGATTCVVNIATQLGSQVSAGGQKAHSAELQSYELRSSVLSVVVKLLSEEALAENVPHVLASLVGDYVNLQKSACDAGAVASLTLLLEDTESSARQREGLMLCLGVLCQNREESRKQLVESKGLQSIVQALQDAHPGVRAAACSCAKSLSRSVKSLRTNLAEANIAGPLFKLLVDPDPSVQALASASIGNLVLDFSPLKAEVLRAGAVQHLAGMIQSEHRTLRINSLWALRNLLFCADLELKATVMEELTWPTLLDCFDDPEEDIQLHAISLVRNLASGPQEHVDLVLQHKDGAVLRNLVCKLAPSAKLGSHCDELRQEALFAVVNIAAGREEHKKSVMNSGIMHAVVYYMSDQSTGLRTAAVWVVINLIWADGESEPGPGLVERANVLKDMGVCRQLDGMVDDSNLDVKDRTDTALHIFRDVLGPAYARPNAAPEPEPAPPG